jgi:general L-amino acid transport system substrate-binding protein
VIEILLNAESVDLTQHNATSGHSSSDPTVQILAGQTREIGTILGLENDWAVHVLATVGNYGEIYDRDLGDQSPLKLPRALNRLSTQGGLQLSLPLK